MESILDIGLTGEFEDGKAKIIGKTCFESETIEMIIWRLKSETGEFFYLREMLLKGEEDEDDEVLYDLLSEVDPDDKRTFEEIANDVFSDWKCFAEVTIENNIKAISSEGKTGDLPLKKSVVKMADVFYEDEESDYMLEEDDILADFCIMWNTDSTWVFCIEGFEEDEIAEIFGLDSEEPEEEEEEEEKDK